MEKSKGEASFDALGLNPQLFINNILNTVDDTVDAAFNFFYEEALKLLGSGSDGSSTRWEDLAKGISSIRYSMEGVLDKQMSMWENYCLTHCFSVPEGFVLPKNQDSSGYSLMHSEPSGDQLSDKQLDLQLDYLRMMLDEAGKKNAKLQGEIQSLEKQSKYNAAALHALLLYEQNYMPQVFEEMEDSAAKLQKKMQEAMKKIMDDAEGRGLLNMDMLKGRIVKQDEHLWTRLEGIKDVAKILKSK